MSYLSGAARRLGLAFVAAAALWTAPVHGAVIDLAEYAFNIDGIVSDPTVGDPVPPEADISGFSTFTGLGTIAITITDAGGHNVDLFVDHEIDQASNTFFNEYGSAINSPPWFTQSWEIDEPGFAFGDIFTNFTNSSLDNTNAVPVTAKDDVSMALGWDFILGVGEKATIEFVTALGAPTGGLFYLAQTDDDSGTTIYFSSTIKVAGQPVPEPGTLSLLGLGVLAWGATSLRRRREG